MEITAHLSPADRERVEARLRSNLIAWFTTVSASGQPTSVPVWFVLREDGTILMYTRPQKQKLRNLAADAKVHLALDMTDIGRNIVRLTGVARRDDSQPPAHEEPAYLAKYLERMGAMFDTPESFGEQFSVPIVITPTKVFV